MPYLTVPDTPAAIELHYQDVGQGDPVVLIHGWPLSGRSWEAQIAPLVDAGYRVVTYDRRGFGGSSQPWTGYDYDRFSQDLEALLVALDLKKVTLVGFSMGGGEVARYLGMYGSKRIARAVFAAAVTPYRLKAADNPEGKVTKADIAERQSSIAKDRLAFLEAFSKNFYADAKGKLLVSEAQRQYTFMMAAFASPKGTRDCIAAFSGTDFRADLAKITIPTLVIHGDSDQIVPLADSGMRTHKAVKGSQMHVIKGGPHGCNLSHADEFNQVLIDFLRAT